MRKIFTAADPLAPRTIYEYARRIIQENSSFKAKAMMEGKLAEDPFYAGYSEATGCVITLNHDRISIDGMNEADVYKTSNLLHLCGLSLSEVK